MATLRNPGSGYAAEVQCEPLVRVCTKLHVAALQVHVHKGASNEGQIGINCRDYISRKWKCQSQPLKYMATHLPPTMLLKPLMPYVAIGIHMWMPPATYNMGHMYWALGYSLMVKRPRGPGAIGKKHFVCRGHIWVE